MQRAADDGAFQFRVQFDLQFPHGAGGADDASEHRRIRLPLPIQGQAFAVDVVALAGVVQWGRAFEQGQQLVHCGLSSG